MILASRIAAGFLVGVLFSIAFPVDHGGRRTRDLVLDYLGRASLAGVLGLIVGIAIGAALGEDP